MLSLELVDVLEMTVHRDLNKLAENGLLDKVHGGAVAKRVAEIPYRAREVHHQAVKQAVARVALKLIRPGMFIATTGINLEEGLSVYSETEARVLQRIIKSARKTVLLTDSSKFDKVMGPVATPLHAIHGLICETDPPEAYAAYCRDNDIEVITAPRVETEGDDI